MMEKNDSPFRTFRGYELAHQRAGRLTPALEDYLEMTYRLCAADDYARVGRLSELLNVKPSSVSKMIAKLAQFGYLQWDRYDIIRLTELGKTTGAYLVQRHETIEGFLRFLGSESPLEETELIEHSLSPSTVNSLRCVLAYLEANPAVSESLRKYLAAERPDTAGKKR